MCKNSSQIVLTYWWSHHQTGVSASQRLKKHWGKTCSSTRICQKNNMNNRKCTGAFQTFPVFINFPPRRLCSVTTTRWRRCWERLLIKSRPLSVSPSLLLLLVALNAVPACRLRSAPRLKWEKKRNLWEVDAPRQEEHPFKVRRLNVTPPAWMSVWVIKCLYFT